MLVMTPPGREIDHALPDPEIIVLAQQENRIILTADKDFGALVFHAGHQSPGIILIRIKNREPRNVRILSIFAEKGQELRGKFCVITDHAVRTRTLLQ